MNRVILVMLLCVTIVGAQQAGSLVWNPNGSNITVNGPTTPGAALTYAFPAKSGTVALTSDVTTPSIVNGSISLTNGTGSATLPTGITRCVVSDPSGNSVKYSQAPTTLTVFGVGPVVHYICV
jgi:hypothetical protein